MNVTEIVVLVWVLAVVALDLWLHFSGRETISQMMTRFGRSKWWVPAVYAGVVVYFFFHFFPWFLPF